jgi:hypothetical protein
LSGELVYYLYEAGIRRGQSPQELLVELANTAMYLDANFPDENVSSLREQLLLKVLAAERASRELDQVLSALETQLVDATKVLENMEVLMLSVVGGRE